MAVNKSISNLRSKIMSPKRIISTGNPVYFDKLASGLQNIPNIEFISRSNGFDLDMSDIENQNKFVEKIRGYNIFINLSWIKLENQIKLLELVNKTWKFGHVINIGSVSDQLSTDYGQDKLALRELSLKLNTYRLRTTYIQLGELTQDQLKPKDVGELISWLISSKFDVPIIGYEPEKAPW